MQLDYYSKFLATCSSDCTIRIYSMNQDVPELLFTIKELGMDLEVNFRHSGPVWKIAWSHPRYGSLLASCSYDGSVKIFKFEDTSYSVVYTYEGHKASGR